MTNFVPHKYQWAVLESKARFILASAGVQAGKSVLGAVWLLRRIQDSGFKGTYLIAAPVYKMLSSSTLPKFFEMCGGVNRIGRFKQGAMVIELIGGGRVYMRSCEEPDYLEGMTITGGAWLDEAGQMSERVFTNVVGRVAIARAPILMTTTPYRMNWIYREIYKRWQRGEKDYEVVQWRSIDNPVFSKEEYEQRRATMNENDFARRYGGEWRQISGLVYPDFSYEKCVVEQTEYDPDWEYYAGIDWGFTNPTAILWAGIDQNDYVVYILDEYYKRGQTSTEIADYVKSREPIYPKKIREYFCDPSGRDEIGTFVMSGIKNIYGIKTDVMDGIRQVTELIRTGRLKIFKNCVNLIGEMEEYHLPSGGAGNESRDPNEEPIKKHDHAVDALRYLVVNTNPLLKTGIYKLQDKISDNAYFQKLRWEEQKKRMNELGKYYKENKPQEAIHL